MNIFNQNICIDRFCLFVIDKIYLVKEWDKQFMPLYTEIEKVWKKITVYIPLVAMLTIMILNIWANVASKTKFLTNY